MSMTGSQPTEEIRKGYDKRTKLVIKDDRERFFKEF